MKTYICECGKEFVNPQSFNGHKSHCKIHLGDRWEARQETMKSWVNAGQEAAKKVSMETALQKENNRREWLAEEHHCEWCDKLITEFIGTGQFCSISCGHSFSAFSGRLDKTQTKEEFIEHAKLNKPLTEEEKQLRKEQRLVTKKEKYQEYLLGGSDYTEHMTKKFRPFFLEEQNYCCTICGMKNEWQGKPLTFILDHIDGDSTNNVRSNLRFICPNCDSQLDTYKSKNKHSTRDRKVISKQEYEKLVSQSDNNS